MFSKSNKPTQKPAAKAPSAPPPLDPALIKSGPPIPAASPKATSVIGQGLTIEGGVTGEGELHVDGVVRGDVRVNRLSLGENGLIEGSVFAELVEARGKVVGSITAKQIRLFGTAHIDGDITHEQLAMETGAFFQGRSLKFQRSAQAQPHGMSHPHAHHPQDTRPAPSGDVINLGIAGGN